MNKKIKFLIIIICCIPAYFFYRLCRFWLGKTGGNEGWIAETQPSSFWRCLTNYWWKFFFTVYNRLEIINEDYVPKESEENFVTVANHASILDGFLMSLAVWKNFFIMVKKEAFDMPLEGWYLRKAFCFPVDRSKVDTVAIKRAMKVLSDGYCLGLFPEGTRNRKGYVSEFKAGVIKLALKRKIKIIPAYIANTHNVTPINTIFPRPAKITITFLKPIDTKKELESGKSEKEILDMLYKQITDVGTKIMGYDVRDPEYIKKLSSENH